MTEPACDYPVCIGGECCWECERLDKHKEWLKELECETADRNEVGRKVVDIRKREP